MAQTYSWCNSVRTLPEWIQAIGSHGHRPSQRRNRFAVWRLIDCYESFEFSEWLIQLSASPNLRLAIIYWLQNDADVIRISTSTFSSDFTISEYLESSVIIIVAVTSIFMWTYPKILTSLNFLISGLESFCLQQHVEGPAHIHEHTLDLVITQQSNQIVQSSPRVDLYLSDHASMR